MSHNRLQCFDYETCLRLHIKPAFIGNLLLIEVTKSDILKLSFRWDSPSFNFLPLLSVRFFIKITSQFQLLKDRKLYSECIEKFLAIRMDYSINTRASYETCLRLHIKPAFIGNLDVFIWYPRRHPVQGFFFIIPSFIAVWNTQFNKVWLLLITEELNFFSFDWQERW